MYSDQHRATLVRAERHGGRRRIVFTAASVLAILVPVPVAAAPSLLTLFTFNSHALDGMRPQGAAIAYINNAIYAATPYGGTTSNHGGVYKLKPKLQSAPLVVPWKEALAWSGAPPGAAYWPTDITTVRGGPMPIFFTTASGGPADSGSIMQTDVLPNGTTSNFQIHNFTGIGSDPAVPVGALTPGPSSGGTNGAPVQFSFVGAAWGGSSAPVCGSIYVLASPPNPDLAQPSTWTTSILHPFTQPKGADGCLPNDMTRDKDGTIYGTTMFGGTGDGAGALPGLGTVFALTPPPAGGGSWVFTSLYSFQNTRADGSWDGNYPTPGLIVGKDGNLYGTTRDGGYYGNGIVFKLRRPAPGQTAWTETTVYDFAGDALGTGDGIHPQTGVVQDKQGVLYGVTYSGGAPINPFGLTAPGAGTVFSLTPPTAPAKTWAEAVLWRFTGTDGAYPATRPLLFNGVNGTVLIGATSFDTVKAGGTVYRLVP